MYSFYCNQQPRFFTGHTYDDKIENLMTWGGGWKMSCSHQTFSIFKTNFIQERDKDVFNYYWLLESYYLFLEEHIVFVYHVESETNVFV